MTDEKKKPDEDELSAEQLEDVAGGTAINLQPQRGLQVSLTETRQKTTTGKSFSEIAASGLSKAADA